MRSTLPIFGALLCLVAVHVNAAEGTTALQAARLLPKEAWSRVARVAGFEGDLAPERWHILVYDTRVESGLHEYVVSHGEVVASRSVSQFAEELKADEVIGADGIKIDSDKAAAIAKQYAEANKLEMASCNYDLKKDGDGSVPTWRVTCLDEKGEELGQIVLTATKGNVLRHDGFAVEPAVPDAKQQLAAAEAQYRKEVQAYRERQARKAAVASQQPAPPVPMNPNVPPGVRRPFNAGPVQPAPPVAVPVRPARDGEWVAEQPRPGLLQRAGSSVGRIFGGGR